MATESLIKIVDMRVMEYKMNSGSIEEYLKGNNTLKIEIEHRFNFNNEQAEKNQNLIKLDLTIKVMFEEHMFIELKYSMVFDVDLENGTEEEFLNKFAANMISIAFPYVRSYISTTTALAGIQRIDLPSINAYELVEHSS